VKGGVRLLLTKCLRNPFPQCIHHYINDGDEISITNHITETETRLKGQSMLPVGVFKVEKLEKT